MRKNESEQSGSTKMIENLLITENCADDRDIVSQCCICKDFVSKEGTYIKIDPILEKRIYMKYLVSHVYCEPCFNDYLNQELNENEQ